MTRIQRPPQVPTDRKLPTPLRALGPVVPAAAKAHPAAPLEIGALYRAHAQTVARWAARLGGPSAEVEDLVQEVFLTAHRNLASFRGEAKITTWLFRITQNTVRHRRRKEWLRRFLGSTAEDVAARLPSARPTPVEALERRQAEALVYQALEGVGDKYRTAFILFELEGLSGEEVAALTGQKVATVWVWLHRARAHFLTSLQKLENQTANRKRST